MAAYTPHISALARATDLTVAAATDAVPGGVGSLVDGVLVSLVVTEADRDRARKRLSGELAAARGDLAKTRASSRIRHSSSGAGRMVPRKPAHRDLQHGSAPRGYIHALT